MSARNNTAIGVNVNRGGRSARTTSTTGASSAGVVAGGSALNFPEQNRPAPGVGYFAAARAGARRDPTYRTTPR